MQASVEVNGTMNGTDSGVCDDNNDDGSNASELDPSNDLYGSRRAQRDIEDSESKDLQSVLVLMQSLFNRLDKLQYNDEAMMLKLDKLESDIHDLRRGPHTPSKRVTFPNS